jgi:hypothetical protein
MAQGHISLLDTTLVHGHGHYPAEIQLLVSCCCSCSVHTPRFRRAIERVLHAKVLGMSFHTVEYSAVVAAEGTHNL